MNTLSFILGEDFFFYMAAAVVGGLFSGYSLYLRLKGRPPEDKQKLENLLLKIGVIIIAAIAMYYDYPRISMTLFKISSPIGVYKIVQLFTGALLWWRHSKSGQSGRIRTVADV